MANVFTGARGLVKISGEIVAFVSGVSVSQEELLKEIPQLDQLEVGEYAENGHRCTISISTFKLAPDASFSGQRIQNSAATYNLDYPKKPLKTLLLQPEWIIEIVDATPVYGDGGEVVDFKETSVYVATGCKFAGGSGEFTARGLWEGKWNFKCRRGYGI